MKYDFIVGAFQPLNNLKPGHMKPGVEMTCDSLLGASLLEELLIIILTYYHQPYASVLCPLPPPSSDCCNFFLQISSRDWQDKEGHVSP